VRCHQVRAKVLRILLATTATSLYGHCEVADNSINNQQTFLLEGRSILNRLGSN
jgi:hypothetical protein